MAAIHHQRGSGPTPVEPSGELQGAEERGGGPSAEEGGEGAAAEEPESTGEGGTGEGGTGEHLFDDWEKGCGAVAGRVMRRMGWLTGKGLGRREQGIPVCLQPEQRYERQGLGFRPGDLQRSSLPPEVLVEVLAYHGLASQFGTGVQAVVAPAVLGSRDSSSRPFPLEAWPPRRAGTGSMAVTDWMPAMTITDTEAPVRTLKPHK